METQQRKNASSHVQGRISSFFSSGGSKLALFSHEDLINWANISSIDFSHLVSVLEIAVPFQAQLRRPCLEQSHYRIKQFAPALSGLR